MELFGKVTIIKSLLLPKMLYVFSVLTDKVARLAAVNDLKYGKLELSR